MNDGSGSAMPWEFGADMAAIRRELDNTDPAKRPERYRELLREGVRWFTVGGLPKPEVVDRLREIGLAVGLNEGVIQDALAEAIANPFEPNATRLRVVPTIDASAPAKLVIARASDIHPEPIRWLWPGRIAIGKQTLLAGEPGLGKSQLTCWIAGAVTTGGFWPGTVDEAPLGSAIILSAEDDAADTIRPRLDAAGADPDKVHIVSAVRREDGKGRRAFNLQADLLLLENEITRLGDVRLVVIDPVSSYLGKVDSHRNAELRAVLEPIGEMASRLRVAVLSVTHLSKSGSISANSRFIGSIAFVAAARAAFIVARDPGDKERRLLLPTKNNLGPEGSGIGFRIGQVTTPTGLLAPTVLWDAMPVTMSADEALAGPADAGSAPARNEAMDFLRDVLAAGPVPSEKIRDEVNKAGLAWRTVRRAKEGLGVRVRKTGIDGGWVWTLPGDGQA
jgi:putative DNA primase/helicase